MHKKIYDVKLSMFAIPPKHLSCYLNSTPVNAANQRLSGVLFDLKSISYQVSPVFLSKFPEYCLCFFEISLWNTHIPFPTRISVNLSFIGYFLFVLVTLHENVCLNFVLFACLLLQLGLHLSPTRCLLVYTELFAWPDVKSSKLL